MSPIVKLNDGGSFDCVKARRSFLSQAKQLAGTAGR
jgi:hypothetical protein